MTIVRLTSRAEPLSVDAIPVSDDYVLRTWETDDGLPSNIVFGIAQTPDGYLWVASDQGLARFDGAAFTPFLKETTPGLESDRVQGVYVARSGDLWIGLELGGVARWRGNRFVTIAPLLPRNAPTAWITSFAEDVGGGIWFGHASIGKAVRWEDGKFSEFTGKEGLEGFETFVHTDAGRRIWFATKQACGIFDGTRFHQIDPKGGERVVLAPSSDGGMWAARAQRLLRYRADGSREVVADISSLCEAAEVTVLHEDRAGNVWIGTRTAGLFRFRQGMFVLVPTSHADVESIFEDREDNLWVGTRGGGLNRLRPRAFFLRQKKDGLHNDTVNSLCQDGEGKLWLVGPDGTPVHALDSANRSFGIPPNWSTKISGFVFTICPDPAGGVWMGGTKGLLHWRDGIFSLESLREPAIALFVDKEGDLWAATPRGPLVRHHAGTDTAMPTGGGLIEPLYLAADPSGRLWVGTAEGMVFQGQNEQFLPVPLPGANRGETIRFIASDVNDTFWIGALRGGLYRWRGGQVRRMPHDAGLPLDDLRSLAIEPGGDFWIGTGGSLFRAARGEIDSAIEGRQQSIRTISYGRNEGLPSMEFALGLRNTTRTRDGHIWFATTRGALEILPPPFQKTAPLPPVVIEEIRVGGASMPIDGSEKLKLPPKPGQVEIRYTLAQLSAPEQMCFRYRLAEPGEAKWVYACSQRRATFTHLPPGSYRFEVAAAEAGGPWLPATASLAFAVRAVWWETAWFRFGFGLLSALALALLVRFIVKRRLLARIEKLTAKIASQQAIERAFQAEEALQEARAELERVTRVTTMGELAASIAHEINQPLAGVVTSANAGLNWLANNPPNLIKVQESIERILRDGTRAGEVLTRIRGLLKRTSPIKSQVSVNQTISDVLALTGGELRQKNIELAVKLDPSLSPILGDSIQLQQVLLNLIMNAIEAMADIAHRQRMLLVQSELGELDGKPAVAVKVSDTGIGLSPTEGGRLFEAFHTTKPQGMGMGLWISRSIVESHGGRLTAQSNDGPGATFRVLLPVETGSSE